MKRLQQDCFSSTVNCYYEPSFPLPVLNSTSLAILKSKTAGNPRKNLSVGDESTGRDEIKSHSDAPPPPANRSKSADLSKSDQNKKRHVDDLQLIQACFQVISAFMRDSHEPLKKGQGTQLFETTIAERRKNFINKKRLWKRSSSSSGSVEDGGGGRGGDRTPSPLLSATGVTRGRRGRPHSAYFAPDSGYESDKSNLNKTAAAIDSEIVDKMTVIEKVQFICVVGLSHVHLRDEIYCLVLKQINGNPSPRSIALGWILTSLLAGCFPPSKNMFPYVKEVLSEQDTAGCRYCAERLIRINTKGTRKNPPCSLELHAAKLLQKIRLPIICMDHSVRTVWVDSMTTVADICQKVASKNRLGGDAFGFSVFFALDSKIVPLGGGNFYIMDAISQAERWAGANDVRRDSWRVYFRREFFSPHDAAGLHDNYMKLWLTYSQICGGVRSGEYECSKAQDLALLIAHQYCVKNGGLEGIDEHKCATVCLHALPVSVGRDERKKWIRMVTSTLHALQKKEKERGKLSVSDIMEQIVRYASRAYIANFTKTFILSSFDVEDGKERLATPKLMKINHMRIHVSTSSSESKPSSEDQISLQIARIKSVALTPCKSQFRIVIYGGGSCVGKSAQADEIVAILSRFTDEVQSGKNNESQA